MTLDRVFVKLTRGDIGSLLAALASRLGGGLTHERGRAFEAELEGLPADDDSILEEAVEVDGEELPFILDVFGSETEVLEAGFMAPAVVVRVVMEEVQRLFGGMKVRHVPAMPEA